MSILCFKQGVEKYWRKNIQQYVPITKHKAYQLNNHDPL